MNSCTFLCTHSSRLSQTMLDGWLPSVVRFPIAVVSTL